MMFKLVENNPKLSILVIGIFMFAFNMNVMEVTIMEARNFITAREMITDSNWLLTTMNGEPRYQKPPLPTWLAAISALIFGVKSIYAMRIPGFIMVIILSLFSYSICEKLSLTKNHALLNGLITLTSFYIIGIVIEAPWDIFTHGFMLIAIYHLFQLFSKEKTVWKHTLVAGVFIGLSIMSKGPISFYALLLPFIIAYGFIYKYKNFKSKVFSIFSLLIIALVLGGWWYLYVRYVDPETFLAITKKETGNWSSYNVRPFYYYWSFFTQSGLWTIPAFISLLYPYLKSRVSNLKAYKFTLLWTLCAVVLLSIIPEKKSRYLMPVLIPLALNIGFYIEYLIREFKNLKDKRETFPAYFNFGIVSIVAISFSVLTLIFYKDIFIEHWIQFSVASISLLIVGVLMIKHIIKKNIKQVFYLTVGFMACALLFVTPLTPYLKSDSYNNNSSLGAQLNDSDQKLYSLGGVSPEVIWHYGDKIPSIDTKTLNSLLLKSDVNILIQKSKTELKEQFEQTFEVKLIETYNLNSASETSKSFKNRLSCYYYKVIQK